MARRRWSRKTIGCLMVVGVTLPIAGWLAFQRIPSWYRPVESYDADLRRIRASVPRAYQAFTDQLMTGRAFDFKLSSRMVSEWLAARRELWPDARLDLPKAIERPAIAFVADSAMVGVTCRRDELRCVLSARIMAELEGDEWVVRIGRIGAGAMPLPLRTTLKWLSRKIGPIDIAGGAKAERRAVLKDAMPRMESIQDFAAGIRIKNRFFWSNGRRYFRIAGLSADAGVLTMRVEPIPTG